MSQADLQLRLADLANKLQGGASCFRELCDLDPASPFYSERQRLGAFLEQATAALQQALDKLRAAQTDVEEAAVMAGLRNLAESWKRQRGHVDGPGERAALVGPNLEHVLDGGTAWVVANESFLAHMRLRRQHALS